MSGHLTTASRALEEMIDSAATFQADLLRRLASLMEDDFDRAAQRDVEGASDWRELNRMEKRYAG